MTHYRCPPRAPRPLVQLVAIWCGEAPPHGQVVRARGAPPEPPPAPPPPSVDRSIEELRRALHEAIADTGRVTLRMASAADEAASNRATLERARAAWRREGCPLGGPGAPGETQPRRWQSPLAKYGLTQL